VFWLASAWAGLSLGLSGPEEIGPGQRLDLELELTADTAVAGVPALDLPDGWRLLLPEPRIDVDAHRRQVRRLKIQVPRDAPAGEATLAWCARGDDDARLGCAEHAVRVQEQRLASLDVLGGGGTVLAGEQLSVDLSIQNRGNSALRPDLEVRCPEGLRCAVGPPGTLAPGATSAMRLDVQAGARGIGEVRVGLRLQAGEQLLAKAEVPVTVIGGRSPRRGPAANGRVNARARVGTTGWDVVTGLQLQSTGPVSQTQTLALRVREDGLDPNSQAVAQWSGRGWALEGGWRQTSLAPTLKQPAAGLDLQGRLGETWGLSGGLQRGADGVTSRLTAFGTLGKARLEGGVLVGETVRPLVQLSHPWMRAAALFDSKGLSSGQLQGGVPTHLRLDASWRRAETTRWRARALWTRDWTTLHTELGWQSEHLEATHHQLLVRLRSLGQSPWILRADVGPTRQLGSVRLARTRPDTRLAASAALQHADGALRVTGGATADRVQGRWRPGGEVGGRWEDGAVQATMGGRLEHHAASTVVQGRATVDVGERAGWMVGAAVRHQTRTAQTVQAGVEMRRRDGSVGVNGSIAVSAPFRVPLPDPATSTVRGRVHHRGEGVAGVVVRLGDRATVTRRDGTFVLHGVAPGEHVVDVVDRVPPGEVPLEQMPRTVTFGDDGGTLLDIELGRAATVVAQARWTGPERSLEGVLVELVRGEERLRRLLDADGQVELSHVRPGTWSIRVDDRGLLPSGSTWEAPETLVVEPGANAVIALLASPKQRRIQMLDL
jgi:hypothetical protein